MATSTCDSCGGDDEVVRVRRYYVTPEAWDTPGSVQAGDEEQWCFVCRTHYPHELLGDDQSTDASNPAGPAGPAGPVDPA